ncbi:MAG: hypothetical protein AB1646_16490 [Thermodesulfobacteriota bacterium]
MKPGAIILLAIVAVFACIALDRHLGGAEPDSAGELSALLPSSKNVLFSLGVAEAREAVKKLEKKISQAREAEPSRPCEKPEPLAEVAREIDKELAAQKAEQEDLFTISERIREQEREADRLRGRRDELERSVAQQQKKLATVAKVADEAKSAPAPGTRAAPRAGARPESPGGKEVADETRDAREELERNRQELARTPDQILAAEKQAQEGRRQLLGEMTRTDESGLTWRARALISDNKEFIGLVRRIGGGGGAMKTELVKASASGRAHAVKAMLDSGADVGSEPGEYSALAYARVFGFGEIGRMLEKSGALVQVPWDPNREESLSETTRMIENQLARLRAFSATLGGSGADVGRTAYDLMLLDWVACRFEACKAVAGTKPKVAADKPAPRSSFER